MRLDERDAEIILALAHNNMNVSDTARDMFMHRNSICYHITKVKRVTGLDPMNFYDLHKLVKDAKKNWGNTK